MKEIDEMKDNIKHEINEKYNPKFDENKLSYNHDVTAKRHPFESKIELIFVVESYQCHELVLHHSI